MEEKLENVEQFDISEETDKAKPSKQEKRVKWILIWVWVLVWICLLLWFLSFYLHITSGDIPWQCHDNPNYNPNIDCSYTVSTGLNDDFNATKFGRECEFKYHTKQYCFHKPIIYLYPTEETQINVELWTPKSLSHTYPKYNPEKWRNIIAQPNWDLKDIDTWRKLYALYWEWKNETPTNFNEWFVVAWKDIIPFLEEKLAILWLNEREAEEFIVYWLPQMEDNKYNLIRFETIEEQNENMPLNITPAPDAVIRVMMDWKVIDEPIDIPQQHLTIPERKGFTVVEWWGSPRN